MEGVFVGRIHHDMLVHHNSDIGVPRYDAAPDVAAGQAFLHDGGNGGMIGTYRCNLQFHLNLCLAVVETSHLGLMLALVYEIATTNSRNHQEKQL